jgi:wyosine [tRNA(Phe)-imidazoG37] synthetase (radical SAM superfamily)
MIPFGPVPSRRLGRSLGINNIPPKICTYSCGYCQVGRTLRMQVERAGYYPVDRIIEEVGEKIEKVRAGGDTIDYLTFVPDGEPTLDMNLGQEIEMLGRYGIKTAVITNASLLWREDVRKDLLKADWVSVKVDSVRETAWRKINRPHPGLNLDLILQGILEFSRVFVGELDTETMLVKDLNDEARQVEETARYLSSLRPARAYLSIPTRPPALGNIQSPAEAVINRSYQIFSETLDHVEYLIGYEGNAFTFTGNAEEDILSITAVHPMRQDAVRDFLDRSNADGGILKKLLTEGKLVEIEYQGSLYYLRKFTGKYGTD